MSEALRIVHVVRQYAPSVGGLEAVVARLASEQRRVGHTVRVVTLDRLFLALDQHLAAAEVVDGVPVKRLGWTGSPRYPLCPQVVAHLAEADLVHVHAIDFFFDWLSLTRWLHRKPMVASTHGGFFHTAFASTLKRIWFGTVTRFSSLGYRRLVATSENDGAIFERIAGKRVVVVENGADLERFRDAASPMVVPVLIYFGRWSSNKGLPALIRLVAALRKSDPRWTLIVAGRPYDLDRAALTALVDAAGVTEAVELHESPSDAALRLLIARASYFVCLSRHEGFGIAAIEAMSAGLLPLLSDIPPFRKIVSASGLGLLLPLDVDEVAGADAVTRLEERVSAEGIDRAAIVAFAQRYEWSMVARRYDAVYRSALGLPHVDERVVRE